MYFGARRPRGRRFESGGGILDRERIELQFIIDYCLGKEGAYLDCPFGDIPICAKWKKHIFAEIYPKPDDYKITLRCDPEVGKRYRSLWPERVVPAYHVPERQKPFKSTILLGEGFDLPELLKMIDHSYETLLRKCKE